MTVRLQNSENLQEVKILYSKCLISNSWSTVKIKDVTRVLSGKTPFRGILKYFGGKYPWIKTTDLNGNSIRDTEEKITTKAINEVKMKLIPKNSVLIAMYGGAGTVGKSAYTDRSIDRKNQSED